MEANYKPRLERMHLKDQIAEILRLQIITNEIKPGTKLVERDVAEWMGVSRAPVRDALLELENEGLLESRTNGRYVIELTSKDVNDLIQVRTALELLATELVTKNHDDESRRHLESVLKVMKDAVENDDREAFHKSDLLIHRTIWEQAKNPHLLKMLNYIIGPIFMFIANPLTEFDLAETYQYHENLVNSIHAGDIEGVHKDLEEHMENTLTKRIEAIKR